MNWGTRIVILYVAFVALILFMVIRSMNEKVDLVSDDYYQKELQFQNQIDRSQESQTLLEQPQVKMRNGNVEIMFPTSLSKKTITGKIDFYRPSDSSKDLSYAIKTDTSGLQLIADEKMLRGIYNVQLTWEAAGKNYYNELAIYIP